MNEEVLSKAKELAAAIARSPEYITMRATEDAAGQDEALTELFARYNDLHRDMERLTLAKEPDFDQMGDLNRDLETVQAEIRAQSMYVALQSARKNFSGMMAQVNAELSSALNPGGASGGCGGNCAGCSGCG